MIRKRASLAMLMGLILLLALGLGAMKARGEGLARGIVLSIFVGLLVATLGAIVRRRHRPAWIGYALFGWGHLLLIVIPPGVDIIFSDNEDQENLWRVDGLAGGLASIMHPQLPEPAFALSRGSSKERAEYEVASALYEARVRDFECSKAIGVAFQGLAFSLCGALAGRQLADRPGVELAHNPANRSEEARPAPEALTPRPIG